MKIAFVSQPWDLAVTDVGGYSSIPIITYQIARRLVEMGHKILIYAKQGPGQSRSDYDANQIEFRRFPITVEDKLLKPLKLFDRLGKYRNPKRPAFASEWYYLGYALRIGRDLQRERPDIIHMHQFSQFVSIMRRLNPAAKLVLHMNCEWLSQLDSALVGKRLAQTDLVLGCSDFVTGETRRQFPQFANRCQTVYNGVDATQFNGAHKPNPNNPQSPGRVLYVGRLSPEKGIHILLEAFKTVVRHFPQAQLEVVGPPGSAPYEFLVGLSDDPNVQGLAKFYGNGLLKSDLRSYAEYLKDYTPPELADQIHFLEFVPHSELVEHYRNADVLVNPSLSEAFGMSLVEAMAVGTPVVGTNIGGMRDIIAHGENGLLVAPNNSAALAGAIIHLLENDALRQSMGWAGKEAVRTRFSWDCVTNSLIQHYQRIISESQ